MKRTPFIVCALATVALAAGIAEAQQRKNRPNANGPGGPSGPGGPGGRPPIGQVLPSFLQDQLKVTAAQKQKIEALQKDVDAKLAAILTDEQNKALADFRERGPGGFGPPPGQGFGGPPGGGFGGPPGGPDGAGFGGPPGGGPDGGGFGGPPGGGRSRSPIGQIMAKLGSPRGSLTQLVGQELKQSSPPWNKIQTQTREYVQQANDLPKYDPPRGTKESWSKLTTAFADFATALDKAAQAKDKKAAVAAQGRLASSCMACHREHRGMGPGGGGPGFGPGGPSPDNQ